MRSLAFALLVLAAPPLLAASKTDDCRAAYDPVYEERWEYPRDAWDARCEKRENPRDLYRKLQRAFIGRCRKRFENEIKEEVLARATVYARCAQGVGGRESLVRLASGKPEDAAEEKSPPRGFGPVAQALELARRSWSQQACVTGIKLHFNDYDGDGVDAETLSFVLYSPELWETNYVVAFQPGKAPFHQETAANPKAENACLRTAELDIDLDGALDIADGAGVVLRTTKERPYWLETYARIGSHPVWTVVCEASGKRVEIDAASGEILAPAAGDAEKTHTVP